jgi:hypothetical protein
MHPSLSFDLQMFDSGLLLCFTIGGGHVHTSALLPGLVPHANESRYSKKLSQNSPSYKWEISPKGSSLW